MTAPIADKIILPLDTGNTGKKVRTQTRIVGSDTVHEHFFILTSARSVLGGHKWSSGTLTVPAAVHNGTTTGLLWFQNPVSGTRKVAIKQIRWSVQFVALAVDLLGGELRFSRHTFTGVGSAGLITPAKRISTDSTAQAELRTASTSEVVTIGATLHGSQYPTMDLATGGAGHWIPFDTAWGRYDDEDDEVILLPGEGISIWHAIAVTTANRRLFVSIEAEEFE